MFKPTRPKEVNEIIKKYIKAKTPHFFMYAKNKEPYQVEEPTDSIMNKIAKTITNNKCMFKHLSKLGKIDYRIMQYDNVPDESIPNVDKTFFAWNKKYGNVVIFDEDYLEKNNLGEIKRQVLEDLRSVCNDDKAILNSLVHALYSKPSSRKKKLFWYIFGEELYNNVQQNCPAGEVCKKCGNRVDALNKDGLCEYCYSPRNGYKHIRCEDCGDIVKIKSKNSTTTKCGFCQTKANRIANAKRMKKVRTALKDDNVE